jgi:hypothetical protein
MIRSHFLILAYMSKKPALIPECAPKGHDILVRKPKICALSSASTRSIWRWAMTLVPEHSVARALSFELSRRGVPKTNARKFRRSKRASGMAFLFQAVRNAEIENRRRWTERQYPGAQSA